MIFLRHADGDGDVDGDVGSDRDADVDGANDGDSWRWRWKWQRRRWGKWRGRGQWTAEWTDQTPTTHTLIEGERLFQITCSRGALNRGVGGGGGGGGELIRGRALIRGNTVCPRSQPSRRSLSNEWTAIPKRQKSEKEVRKNKINEKKTRQQQITGEEIWSQFSLAIPRCLNLSFQEAKTTTTKTKKNPMHHWTKRLKDKEHEETLPLMRSRRVRRYKRRGRWV